jgi:hypothetical protein
MSSARLAAFLLVVVLGAVEVSTAGQSLGRSYLLIVSGLGGEPAYRDQFYEWSISLLEATGSRYGLPAESIWYLGEKPDRDPERIRGKSTKDGIKRALDEVASLVEPGDQVLIVLIGHGSYRSGESRFNLPGPDITAEEFARLLERFDSQQIVFVNTASASGGFIQALSGENRVIVTATKSGMERNETHFGKYFIEAFVGEGADVDKDKRVSVLEAFEYARLHVAHAYEEGNQLQTEHALLDDNGDREGTQRPGESEESADGSLAKLSFVMAGTVPGASADDPEDPELVALYRDKRALEQRIEALKQQKNTMSSELYFQELEKLLVELARKNQVIAAMAEQPR